MTLPNNIDTLLYSNCLFVGLFYVCENSIFRLLVVHLVLLFFHADKKYEAVVLPLFGVATPFHISTIKV